MTNQELYKEIKEISEDIKDLTREFYIFKGKAYGFIAVISVIINAGVAYLTRN